MAVTIQQIAERAGVSRGTVDRALNDRGRINPEVAKQIKELAAGMGYVQKERKKKPSQGLRLGIVTQLSKSSFMLEVNRGIHKAAGELKERGVEVLLKESLSVDEKEQIEAINQLIQEGIQGLAVMPVDCEAVRGRLNEISEENKIPVVTFNSDIVGTRRICYVGMDNRKSGQTAAGLMGMLTRGSGKVLVITGHFGNNVSNARVDGFVAEVKKCYPNLEIAGVQGSFDNAQEVERIIKNTMLNIPGINGVVVVSGGQAGIEKAYSELKLERRPYTIIYDLTPRNSSILKNDIADFLIDQEGYVQGYKPLHILTDYLIKQQQPNDEYSYTHIDIKMKYNL